MNEIRAQNVDREMQIDFHFSEAALKQIEFGSNKKNQLDLLSIVQSGASSLAKHGGAYFSAVYGSIKDPIAAPWTYETQECKC